MGDLLDQSLWLQKDETWARKGKVGGDELEGPGSRCKVHKFSSWGQVGGMAHIKDRGRGSTQRDSRPSRAWGRGARGSVEQGGGAWGFLLFDEICIRPFYTFWLEFSSTFSVDLYSKGNSKLEATCTRCSARFSFFQLFVISWTPVIVMDQLEWMEER